LPVLAGLRTAASGFGSLAAAVLSIAVSGPLRAGIEFLSGPRPVSCAACYEELTRGCVGARRTIELGFARIEVSEDLLQHAEPSELLLEGDAVHLSAQGHARVEPKSWAAARASHVKRSVSRVTSV
jgi:hypothetical protein